MNKNIVILGTQWGDEGKGKIVDFLSSNSAYVVRYHGGHNAGHTLVLSSILSNSNIIKYINENMMLVQIKCYVEALHMQVI